MEANVRLEIASPAVAETEADLVERARNGDTGAFEGLYRQYSGRLFAVCLRLAGSRADAEELVQEAFIKAWERLPGFRGEAAFASWLHRIAVNCSLDRQRSRVRRSAWFADVDDEMLERTRGRDSDPALGMDLEAAIAALPDGARHVFVLHVVEGYSHEDIASLTGLAVGTCKAHVHRARKLLSRSLR